MPNNLVVCGGTFDHFHKGHKKFLNYALSLSRRLIVGLTSDDYIKSAKYNPSASLRARAQSAKLIEDYKIREKSVKEFLVQKKVQDKTEIIKINDLFGPTLDKNLPIDAIVVSQDSKKGAEIINQKRKELGLKDLNILVAPPVYGEDRNIISSEKIRKGEIDRMGKLYVREEWLSKDFQLTEDLRREFQKPFGDLLLNARSLSKDRERLIITVGDVTAKTFNDLSLEQNLSVIDFKVGRIKKFANIQELGFAGAEVIFNVDNPPGFITSHTLRKLIEIFKLGLREKTILQINGEEDLAVLPIVLIAPLGTFIFYGQPHEGLVKVIISEDSKNKAYNLFLKLKSV